MNPKSKATPLLKAKSKARSRARAAALRRHAIAIGKLIDELEPEDLETGEWRPGDVAQLLPSTHETFGGSLLLVTKATPYKVTGCLLPLHRGGYRDAWRSFTPGQLARIGHAPFRLGVTHD